jgi:hypothetical protein
MTATTHIAGRNRLRFSYETHYVGDVRAVNVKLLDQYQLKSLDGIFTADIDELEVVPSDTVNIYTKKQQFWVRYVRGIFYPSLHCRVHVMYSLFVLLRRAKMPPWVSTIRYAIPTILSFGPLVCCLGEVFFSSFFFLFFFHCYIVSSSAIWAGFVFDSSIHPCFMYNKASQASEYIREKLKCVNMFGTAPLMDKKEKYPVLTSQV